MTTLRPKGCTDDELVDTGLGHRWHGSVTLTDYYRQRVLIPVRDERGDVCGLIGRNVGDDRWPKYKNPPRTAVYDKSVNLYKPLPGPRPGSLGQVIVVEGTLDAMAIAVAAIRAGRVDEFVPVTQSGRELSPAQLQRVMAFRKPIVLAFDGDSAGQDSSRRHAAAAVRRGCDAWVSMLPAGQDPASWLQGSGNRGLEVWEVGRRQSERTRQPRLTTALSYVRALSVDPGASVTGSSAAESALAL